MGSTECLSREYSQIQGSPGPWIHHRSSTCVHEGIPTFPAWSHPLKPLRALHKQGICHQFQRINLECQTLAGTLDQHHCLELGCCGNFPGFWVFFRKTERALQEFRFPSRDSPLEPTNSGLQGHCILLM